VDGGNKSRSDGMRGEGRQIGGEMGGSEIGRPGAGGKVVKRWRSGGRGEDMRGKGSRW